MIARGSSWNKIPPLFPGMDACSAFKNPWVVYRCAPGSWGLSLLLMSRVVLVPSFGMSTCVVFLIPFPQGGLINLRQSSGSSCLRVRSDLSLRQLSHFQMNLLIRGLVFLSKWIEAPALNEVSQSFLP